MPPPKINLDEASKFLDTIKEGNVLCGDCGKLWMANRKEDMIVEDPYAWIVVEDFREPFDWFFFHPELHVILDGEAKVTWSSVQTLHAKKEIFIMKKGDAYLLRPGDRVRFEPTKGPYRKLCVVMPLPVEYRPFLAAE